MVLHLAVSTLPLICVYIATKGQTSVLLPKFAKGVAFSLGGVELMTPDGMLHLGPVYYLYLIMLIIFCLNSINILAGVNGLEAGQSFIIGLGFIVYNLIELSSPSTLPGWFFGPCSKNNFKKSPSPQPRALVVIDGAIRRVCSRFIRVQLVSGLRLRWRYVLLLERRHTCCDGHCRPLFQDGPALFYSTGFYLN